MFPALLEASHENRKPVILKTHIKSGPSKQLNPLKIKYSYICFLLRNHGSPQIQYRMADRKRRLDHVNQDVQRGDSAELLSIMLLLYPIQRYERFDLAQ